MKIFMFFVTAVFLFGCAGPIPEHADLNIEIAGQAQKVYPENLEVNIIGQDRRSDPYILFYQIDHEPDIKIASRVPPQLLVQESLDQGLRRQGLNQGDGSGIEIVVIIKNLLAKVTRSGLLYTTKAKTHLQLVVRNNGSTLTLYYNLEATKDTLTRPKVLDLEMLLNNQLDEIVTKMLTDQRVRAAIMGR